MKEKFQTEQLVYGEPLAVSRADKKKLTAIIILRAALVMLGYFLSSVGFDGSPVFNVILLLVMVTVVLFPLRHIKDYIAFYPSAICSNGKQHPFPPHTQVTWRNFEGYAFSTKQMMFNGISIDISYLKDAKALFYRTYGDVDTDATIDLKIR